MHRTDFDSYVRAHVARRARGELARGLLIEEGWDAARKAAELLVRRFGARQVVLFGSLASGRFHHRSDIDLAVWGLADVDLFTAMAATARGSAYDISLVPAERAEEPIRAAIDGGVKLWPR